MSSPSSSLQNPFTEFAREHRPLSEFLLGYLKPVDRRIRELETVAEVDAFRAEELEDLLASCLPAVPGLSELWEADQRAADWVRIPGTSKSEPGRAQYVGMDIIGDPSVFSVWPDADPDLRPVDSPEWPPGPLTVEDADRYWTINTRGHEDKRWGVYNCVTLTRSEMRAIADGELDLPAIVAVRVERVRAIVDAMARQVQDFRENLAPARIEDFLEQVREDRRVREAVSSSLALPKHWQATAPALEPASRPPEAAASEAEPKTGGSLSTEAEGSADVDVPVRPRLSAASFSELQQVIRRWADAMERYPDAYAGLVEERVSDLLAATLSATLPHADREVYSRTGKSDIFVRADVLEEGRGPAKVFIAEAKWASGDDVVRQALDPQLFSYLTTSDLAGVLLLLHKQLKFTQARHRYLSVLQGVEGYLGMRDSAVAGWPLLMYRREGRLVEICVASVHLPPPCEASGTAQAGLGLPLVAIPQLEQHRFLDQIFER